MAYGRNDVLKRSVLDHGTLNAHVVEWLCMGREDGFTSLTILEIRDLHFLVDIILGFST